MLDNNATFDPAAIEQMEVGFEMCLHCGGYGIVTVAQFSITCPACHGTGWVEKEG